MSFIPITKRDHDYEMLSSDCRDKAEQEWEQSQELGAWHEKQAERETYEDYDREPF